MQSLLVVGVWVLTLLVGWFIGFINAYMKKKGENLATQEDIDKLVEQVRAVTTATKEIEAKISTDVWDRQKRWEMKREVLFEVTKRLGALEEALSDLEVAYKTARADRLGLDWTQQKVEANKQSFDKRKEFTEVRLLAGIACGKEVEEACDAISSLMIRVAAKIHSEDAEVYGQSRAEVVRKSTAAREAIRKELETDKV
jgi:hypothetical protein